MRLYLRILLAFACLTDSFEGIEWLAEIFYSPAILFECRTLFEVTGARRLIRAI